MKDEPENHEEERPVNQVQEPIETGYGLDDPDFSFSKNRLKQYDTMSRWQAIKSIPEDMPEIWLAIGVIGLIILLCLLGR